jgi:hypothetical protein
MIFTENLEFIEERRKLLDRFLKELGKRDYILSSEEF